MNQPSNLRMMFRSRPVELMLGRRSCRNYLRTPLDAELRQTLESCLAEEQVGPWGGHARFALVAATESDRRALRGLGTYGFVRGAPAFIVGAIEQSPHDLEDYGYLVERIVLVATDLGLGTCWLGGTFTRSSFARRIGLSSGESMPAVIALGHAAEPGPVRSELERRMGTRQRLPPEQLFFDQDLVTPLSVGELGPYSTVLDAVRWAPSASNRQPWRIVREGSLWHFFLERIKGYGKGSLLFSLLRLPDLQRVDMGIAMCHFELAARDLGLAGCWVWQDPGLIAPGRQIEYTASWNTESEPPPAPLARSDTGR